MKPRIVMLSALVACASAHANRFDVEMTFKHDDCKVSGSVMVDEDVKAYSVQRAIEKLGAEKVVIPKPTLEFCAKIRDQYGHVKDMVRVVDGDYRFKGMKDGEYAVSLGVMEDGLCQDELPEWSATSPMSATHDLWIDFRCRQVSGEFTEVDFRVFDGFNVSGEIAVPDELDPTGTPVQIKCGSHVCGEGMLDEVGEYRVWVGNHDAQAGNVSIEIKFPPAQLEQYTVERAPLIIGAKHLIQDLSLVEGRTTTEQVAVVQTAAIDVKDLVIVDEVPAQVAKKDKDPVIKRAIAVTPSSSKLHIRKSVFNVTRNAGGELASLCDVLRYTWHYEVKGGNPVAALAIDDETPEFTVLEREPSCGSRDVCAPKVVDGRRGRTAKMQWQFPHELAPGASGHVSFDVRVDPARECPS